MDLMTYLLCKRDGGGGGGGTTYTIATEGRKVTLTDADGNKQEITVPYATTAYSAQKIDGKNVPTLDNAGKIPTDYLPSYVDDVEEYPSIQDFPQTGESGKVYVDTSSDKIYRWTGSQYVDITGGLPHCYDELTTFLENENIVFSEDETTGDYLFTLNFINLVLTGYSDIVLDGEGGASAWGDTENSSLFGAIDDVCTRIAALEEGGGSGIPDCYEGLTSILENGEIVFGTSEATGQSGLILTGYTDIITEKEGFETWGDTGVAGLFDAINNICNRLPSIEDSNLIYDIPVTHISHSDLIMTGYSDIILESEYNSIYLDNDRTWGDTENSNLFDAIDNMCDRIADLEQGGSDNVADVYVNGVSVLDANNIAQLKGYVEVTQDEYDALPASKLTDGIPYYITDNGISPVTDVIINGSSAVNNGVVSFTNSDENVKQTNTTASGSFRVLLSESTDNETRTEGTLKSSKLAYNPMYGALRVGSPSEDYSKSYFVTDFTNRNEVNFITSWGSTDNDKQNINIKATNEGGDITLGGADNTWDGTNSSLKQTVTDIINSNTDENVKQRNVNYSSDEAKGVYRILLSETPNNTTNTGYTRKTGGFTYCPDSGFLEMQKLDGQAPSNLRDYVRIQPSYISLSTSEGSMNIESGSKPDIYLFDDTWDGTNASLKDAISDLSTNISNIEDDVIYRDQSLFSYSNIAGEQEMTLNGTITTIQGYTPIGIINQKITSNDILEVANKILFLYIYLDNNTINYGIKNRINTTLEGTFDVSVRILYKKTTS